MHLRPSKEKINRDIKKICDTNKSAIPWLTYSVYVLRNSLPGLSNSVSKLILRYTTF